MSYLIKNRNLLSAMAIAILCSGCSAAPTLSSLKIEGLQAIEFGEPLEEVRIDLKPVELFPAGTDDDHIITYSCDGLTSKYDECSFSPTLGFRKGKLVVVRGEIRNPGPALSKDLETDLSAKLGRPQVHEKSKLWSDGGVHILLQNTQAANQYSIISFESAER